jgi:hypothetical protein
MTTITELRAPTERPTITELPASEACRPPGKAAVEMGVASALVVAQHVLGVEVEQPPQRRHRHLRFGDSPAHGSALRTC